MLRIFATIHKEYLTLTRDKAGLALLFFMPLVLIIMMALIQDAPFRDYQELKFKIIMVDNDHQQLSDDLVNGLEQAKKFSITRTYDNKPITDAVAKKLVNEGKFQFAIIIPKGTTKQVEDNGNYVVSKLLNSLGLPTDTDAFKQSNQLHIDIIFDPTAKSTFKIAINNAMEKLVAGIETKMVLMAMRQQLGTHTQDDDQGLSNINSIEVKEIASDDASKGLTLMTNSVQHNVPAWTIFAMFFIVIPLGGTLLKEREDGSLLRLKLMPGSYTQLLLGKVIFYVIVCFVQFALMMAVGVFLIPYVGLPALQMGNHFFALAVIAIAIAFAATSYGVLIGTIFKTPSQSLTFGSVSVVILSAIGGIWIPIYVMPPILQKLGAISPLAWGLNGINDLFLRREGLLFILPQVFKLLLFSTLCIFFAQWFEKKSYR
jgi:ABC-2 type transport system permease protein